MSPPLCPSCRERMSSVEAGMVGVWSCVYCDGAWLPASRAQGALASRRGGLASGSLAEDDPAGPASDLSLLCPECDDSRFRARRARDGVVFECAACGSVHLPNATVVALGKALGGADWEIGRSLAELFSPGAQSRVDGAVTVVALIYLLLS
ncbi:zf-TFIIB domain-containing protein [Hydrogenophaga luteola]|uniref:Zf-TFIIB domain-containing protein n=1 Tax=Hydrogenophaga luteola TaxID=1591122 RepID=A0ABV7W292_9BURK